MSTLTPSWPTSGPRNGFSRWSRRAPWRPSRDLVTVESAVTMPDKRGFGAIERLSSGRYRARYRGPDLRRHTAPMTFEPGAACPVAASHSGIERPGGRAWGWSLGVGVPQSSQGSVQGITGAPARQPAHAAGTWAAPCCSRSATKDRPRQVPLHEGDRACHPPDDRPTQDPWLCP